jgi:hypothetical protein
MAKVIWVEFVWLYSNFRVEYFNPQIRRLSTERQYSGLPVEFIGSQFPP